MKVDKPFLTKNTEKCKMHFFRSLLISASSFKRTHNFLNTFYTGLPPLLLIERKLWFFQRANIQ